MRERECVPHKCGFIATKKVFISVEAAATTQNLAAADKKYV